MSLFDADLNERLQQFLSTFWRFKLWQQRPYFHFHLSETNVSSRSNPTFQRPQRCQASPAQARHLCPAASERGEKNTHPSHWFSCWSSVNGSPLKSFNTARGSCQGGGCCCSSRKCRSCLMSPRNFISEFFRFLGRLIT